MRKHIAIGTRGSKLALKQAEIVVQALLSVNPTIAIETRIVTTHGDVNQNSIPLDTIGKGWFTKEIEDALLQEEIDLAAHSLKDMAVDMPAGLHIAAYLPREDARDVLITKNGDSLSELRPDAVIGTDSARRQVQMRAIHPGARMKSLRGNVLTRLEKLSSEEYDAIILAAAALKRLGLKERINHYFEPDEMTPAPGQGILAVQIKKGNSALEALLAEINDENASHAALIERSFSQTIGGGCKSPTGAYAYRDSTSWNLIGMAQEDNGTILREKMSAPEEKKTTLGRKLAKIMLAQLHRG